MTTTHTLKRGETLSGISKQYAKENGLTLKAAVQAVAKANGIADPDRVRAGQQIRFPGAADTFETTPPSAKATVALQPPAAPSPVPAAVAVPFPAPSSTASAAPAAPAPVVPLAPPPSYSALTGVHQQWTESGPGVVSGSIRGSAGGPQRISVAIADYQRPDLKLRTTAPGESGQSVSRFARSTRAVVAINGDFFDRKTLATRGLAVTDGQPVGATRDTEAHTAFLFDHQKGARLDGGQVAVGDAAGVLAAVGGHMLPLVKDGQVLAGPIHAGNREPRSALGIRGDGQLIFFAAEGRRPGSAEGLTFSETASLLKELGAVDAIMLDGGGSTSLVVNGRRVNRLVPQENTERPVANHIALVRTGDEPA